jgi:uncharacterized membrane protein (DUF373 family)
VCAVLNAGFCQFEEYLEKKKEKSSFHSVLLLLVLLELWTCW